MLLEEKNNHQFDISVISGSYSIGLLKHFLIGFMDHLTIWNSYLESLLVLTMHG